MTIENALVAWHRLWLKKIDLHFERVSFFFTLEMKLMYCKIDFYLTGQKTGGLVFSSLLLSIYELGGI